MTTNPERALAYADQGLCPIPLKPRGKRAIVRWKSCQQVPPSPEQVRQWFERFHDANIGILTGERYDLLVLDIDGELGLQSIKGRQLPVTRIIQTGRQGGFQYHYRYPHGHNIGSPTGVLPGIDVRGNGGLVVAPNSVHENGRVYQVVIDEPLADTPGWLIEACAIHHAKPKSQYPSKKGPGQTPSTLVETSPYDVISEGSRNWNIFRAACGFARSSHLFEHHLKRVRGLSQARCQPPLEEDELVHIARQSWGYSRGRLNNNSPTTTAYNSLDYITQRRKRWRA